jgi:hypothetical protein
LAKDLARTADTSGGGFVRPAQRLTVPNGVSASTAAALRAAARNQEAPDLVGGGMKKLLPLIALLLLLAACGGDDEPAVGADAGDDTGSAGGTATVHVALPEMDAVFVEGFGLELVFLDGSGAEIARHDWNDLVTADGEPSDPMAYYTFRYTEQVPAGKVTLVSTMAMSIGGPLEPGEPCETELDLAAGEEATVTVLFGPDEDGACAVVA